MIGKIVVRATLLAGAAAAIALLSRDRLADAVERALRAPIEAAADAARRADAGDHPHARPSPPEAWRDVPTTSVAREVVPSRPEARTATPLHRPRATAAAAASVTARRDEVPDKNGAVHVTRADLEQAVATRLAGASTRLVRDDDGKAIGLAMRGVGMLGRFGVQPGDLLVSAGGLPLRTPDEALAALGALKDAHRVVFVLRRGDAPYALSLEIDDPN